MIVVDTDVIAYSFVRKNAVRSELADLVERKDAQWAVPPIWIAEFRNVLASYIRFRKMPLNEARRLVLAAEASLLRRLIPVTSDEILRLVTVSDCTAYDCEFVAAAKSIGTKLVTGDRKLAEAFPETAVTMEDFVAG